MFEAAADLCDTRYCEGAQDVVSQQLKEKRTSNVLILRAFSSSVNHAFVLGLVCRIHKLWSCGVEACTCNCVK